MSTTSTEAGARDRWVHASARISDEVQAKEVAKEVKRLLREAKTKKIDVEVSQHQRPLPELWGVGRVAQELGVRHNNLYKVKGLPEPNHEAVRGNLWRADVIRDFARARERAK